MAKSFLFLLSSHYYTPAKQGNRGALPDGINAAGS
jgi:hypothetical protein